MDDYSEFREWVVDRGRDPDTADLYTRHVRAAFSHSRGWRGRLNDRGLAPKTRHLIKASLRAWARWKDDRSLEKDLKDVRLPSNQRAKAKRPLDADGWGDLLVAIDQAKVDEPTRAVMGLMCVRGFRVGDILRMTHREIKASVSEGILAFEAKGGRRLEFGVLERMEGYLKAFTDARGVAGRPGTAGAPGWNRVCDLISPRASEETRFKSARHRIYTTLKRVAEDAGLPPEEVHPHRLRRTVAVYFLKKTKGDLVKLKQYFQWASIEVASGYVDHVEREELDKIGESIVPE